MVIDNPITSSIADLITSVGSSEKGEMNLSYCLSNFDLIKYRNSSVTHGRIMASNVSGERSPFEGSCCGSGYQTVGSTPLGSPEEIEVPKYRVVMLGDSGVGKTALVSQFMTSEYMNTYDASLDDEFGERTVSVLLDGEESEMIFIDHPASEMSVENALSTYEPHACVCVYSVDSKPSFQHVEEILNYLWREGFTQDKSVIVVGNKSDLARSRVISQNDGKALAVSRDCKFIETSSGIQHNVDELLVGILKQIRLRESRDKKRGTSKNKLHGSKTSLSLSIAREILQKICMNDITKSRSCENLHVL
ncbi:ras-related protein Rap1-like [Agrilus planipennis]|uniref:Ras-related protein Rap1-like n=1 Tax=Agrilus planipennis TaxID=224129 RepID=A0A1W4WK65_AGRPL|nr:ras-related protein Rap1-like [Agrilus planipennis]